MNRPQVPAAPGATLSLLALGNFVVGMGAFVVGERDVGHLGKKVLGGVGEEFLDAGLPDVSAGARRGGSPS